MKTKKIYQIIKELKEQKGRKLKIICDWDEVLKSREPMVYYKIANEPYSFSEFLQKFWDNADVKYEEITCIIINTNIKEVEEIRTRDPEGFAKRTKELNSLYSGLYNESPWLSIAEDLLKAIQEELIDKFIIVGNYKKGRNKKLIGGEKFAGADPKKVIKFLESFGKFANASFEINSPLKTDHGKTQLTRPQRIKHDHPDFDIFIDDNPNNILETRKLLSPGEDKVYILPDYKTNKSAQGKDIWQVLLSPASLKDEDFFFQNKRKRNENNEGYLMETISDKADTNSNLNDKKYDKEITLIVQTIL